jgi:hypothetical protein
MARADTCPLVAGVDLIGKDPRARAGVLNDATYRRGAADQATPTALDNGRRSPRKLLRAVVARLLGRKA